MSENAPQTEEQQGTDSAASAQSQAATAPVDPSTTIADKEMFSREYVAELRAESEAWQKKHQKALTELHKIKQDTQQQLNQTQQATRERIIRAELKALAMQAGLRDLDGLKLADLSTVTLKDDDTLDGAAEMLAALKEAKPYLFMEPEKSTSPSKTPPAPNPAVPASVKELPDDAYQRERSAYLRTA